MMTLSSLWTSRPRLFEEEGSSDLERTVREAIDRIEKEVGGDPEDQNAISTSFEAIKSSLNKIPREYFEKAQNFGLDTMYSLFLKKERAEILKKYVDSEVNEIDGRLNKIPNIRIPEDSSGYLGVIDSLFPEAARLNKISQLIKGQSSKMNEEADSNDDTKGTLQEIAKISEQKSKEVYAKVIVGQEKEVDSTPLTLEGYIRLLGLRDLFQVVGTAAELQKKIDDKLSKIDAVTARSGRKDADKVKDKLRIIRRLIDGMLLAQLPAISEGKVAVEGTYYKMFKSLMQEDERVGTTHMDTALNNYVFNNKPGVMAEFMSRAVENESPLEEDQLNYLSAVRSWIHSYTVIKENGSLLQKEEDNCLARLSSVYTDKTKEIKNYYLAKDFNLGNFGGIQLKPEIRLPLYTQVKLPVKPEDRIKDSPLRNLIGGIGNIIKGLFSAIPDKIDQQILQSAQARNQAIFAGLSALAKAGTIAVGGKQAGRDYTERVEKPVLKALGAKDAGVKEDMLSMSDASGVVPVNPEAPGQSMQTPSMMVPNNMDTMALAGPGKKKKKKSEPQSANSRVMTFSEFLNRK